MSNWKNLLTKYLIEFVVIVLGITTSYFVESFRDEQWESKKEIQLLGELKIEFEDQLKQLEKRRIFFGKDYRIINFITSSRTDFEALKEDVKKPSHMKTALVDMRYFSPPRDIYNSIVSEGLFKYIQSDQLKILLNKLYQTDYEYMMGNITSEGIYLDNIIFYLTENTNCGLIDKNFQVRIQSFLFLHYKLSLFLITLLYHQFLLLLYLNLQLFPLLLHLFFAL